VLEPLSDTPFVSVFGLTYNHEDYVADAIESVLAQGWPADRFEYVLIDDGSTDATPERAKPYADRITFIRQANQGINRAVTRAIGLLRGEVFVACSGDDMWPEGKLRRSVDHLREHPDAGLVYGDLEAIDKHGTTLAPSVMRASNLTPHSGRIAGKLIAGNFVNAGTMAIRGALRDEILPIPAQAAWEDWWFAFALAGLGPVGYIDAPVYRYRMHGANFVFGLRDPEKLADRLTEEVRFRRYMLGAVAPGAATPSELLAGVESLRELLTQLAGAGRPVDAILAITDEQRAAAGRLAAEAAAVAERKPTAAAFGAARALAADPWHAAAYRVLHAVGGYPPGPVALFDEVRSVVVFAVAEELVAEPALLEGYVSAFGPADDVTLVVVARAWDATQLAAALAPLEPLLERPGLPDILAAPASPDAWLSALTRAECALGLRREPVPGIARYDDVQQLRSHVERRWRHPRF
jgi:Glycosyl transferase family 2